MTRTALVIEPDPAVAEQIRQLLSRFDFQIETMADGNAAVQRAISAPPAVVLLSVEPQKIGYAICNRFKRSPELKAIPLVLMSGEPNAERDFEGHRKLKTRAEDYAKKPLDAEDLLARLGGLLPLGAPRRSEPAQRPAPGVIPMDGADPEIDLSDLAEEATPPPAQVPRPRGGGSVGFDDAGDTLFGGGFDAQPEQERALGVDSLGFDAEAEEAFAQLEEPAIDDEALPAGPPLDGIDVELGDVALEVELEHRADPAPPLEMAELPSLDLGVPPEPVAEPMPEPEPVRAAAPQEPVPTAVPEGEHESTAAVPLPSADEFDRAVPSIAVVGLLPQHQYTRSSPLKGLAEQARSSEAAAIEAAASGGQPWSESPSAMMRSSTPLPAAALPSFSLGDEDAEGAGEHTAALEVPTPDEMPIDATGRMEVPLLAPTPPPVARAEVPTPHVAAAQLAEPVTIQGDGGTNPRGSAASSDGGWAAAEPATPVLPMGHRRTQPPPGLERRFDEPASQIGLAPAPPGRTSRPPEAFSSAREVLALREVINKKEREILDLKDALDGKDRTLLESKQKLRDLERRVRDAEDRQAAAERELAAANERAGVLAKDKEQIRERERQLKQRIDDAQTEIRKAHQEVDSLKRRQAQLIQDAVTDAETARAEAEAQVLAAQKERVEMESDLLAQHRAELERVALAHDGMLSEERQRYEDREAALREEQDALLQDELARAEAQRAADVEAVERKLKAALDRAAAELERRIADAEARRVQDLEVAEAQRVEQAAEADAQREAALADAAAQQAIAIADLEERHKTELGGLAASYEMRLRDAQSKHAEEMAALEARAKADIEAARDQAAQEAREWEEHAHRTVASLEQKQGEALAAERERSRQALEDADALRRAELAAAAEREREALEMSRAEHMLQLKAALADAADKGRLELGRALSEHRREMEKLRGEHAVQLGEVERLKEDELATSLAQHEAELEQVRAEHAVALEEQQRTADALITEATRSGQERAKAIEDRLGAEMTALQKRHAQEIADLGRALAARDRDLGQKTEQIATLEANLEGERGRGAALEVEVGEIRAEASAYKARADEIEQARQDVERRLAELEITMQRAYRKLQSDAAALEKAKKALGIALTLIESSATADAEGDEEA